MLATFLTFETKSKEAIFKAIDSMLTTQHGVTKEKYLLICEQMGVEPDPKKFPTELSDLPLLVQKTFVIYKSLPDRYVSLGMEGSLYDGKDLSPLAVLLDIYQITSRTDKELVLEVILYIEKKSVEAARAKRSKKPGK